jgi:hypothetical protein
MYSRWRRMCLMLCACAHSSAIAGEETGLPCIDLDRACEIRNVHDVTIARARNRANGQVFHILNVHYISWGMYAASVRTLDHGALAYDIDALRDRYQREMSDVKTIQEQHEGIIREIVQRFNIRSVYVAGLAADDPAVADFLVAVRLGEDDLQKAAKTNARLRKYLERAFGTPRVMYGRPLSRNYTTLFKVRYGAPAAMLLSGELADIKGVEDSRAACAAVMMTPDGRLCSSSDAMELREDGIVRNMLKGAMPALIVLGAGHDLEANIKRASVDSCDYIRIQSERCWEKRNERETESELNGT